MISPYLTVLILSYNGKHLLEESISSYLLNDYLDFSVIVIDNGSTDGTKEWVEKNFPEVYVLRTEKNLGYSGGLNLGLDYAFRKRNSDYVVITNNDVKADSKMISELVKIAETDNKIGFVTGKVYYYDNPGIFQTVGYKEEDKTGDVSHIGRGEADTGQYDFVRELPSSDDIFMLVSKQVYTVVGGYDINFQFQCEQRDWQERAKKKGFKIFY